MSVSVVIPVKDGARWLGELLDALLPQRPDEVLVIDSGSTDGSSELARSRGVDVLEIEPGDFGHGRTRNLGAERTRGALIAFLTQDATPCPGWLDAFRATFAAPQVGAAFGPHLPRPDTSPMIARELTEFFAGLDPAAPFLSNVNACYRRACWEEIRFEDVPYAEDQAFGRAMSRTAWEKRYVPEAGVLHAHDYGAIGFMRRYFDEYRGLRRTTGHVEPLDLRGVRGKVAGDRDWLRSHGAGRAELARWSARSVVHHAGRKAFSALGSRAERLPARVQQRISLEGTAAPALPRGGSDPVHHFVLERSREGPAPLLDPIDGQAERESLHLAFVIPPFRRGSGGHNSIFQILSRLERAGHTVSVWLHDPRGWQSWEWPAVARELANDYFAPYDGPLHKGFEHWRGADVVVATGWETAWPVLGLPDCRARAYLVHDHEPEFYPTSADAHWARETYGFDLHPIASSQWLQGLMTERYGAPECDRFDFGVDFEAYRPRPVERQPATVLFYARAITGRRAVPLGMLALQELHRRRPEVRIQLFGELDPIDAPFPYEHLGIEAPEELSWRYSAARVGVVLSMTNYSLIPKEMLACGLPCVDLAGYPSEATFGPDGPIELAAFDPLALCAAIERLIDDQGRWEARSAAGLEFVRGHTWDRAAEQVEAGLRNALRSRPAQHRRIAGSDEGARRIGHPLARLVVPEHAPGTPASQRLLDRLTADDVAAVQAALDAETRPIWDAATHQARVPLTLLFGVWHGVPGVLERTGLHADEPPEDVHAMSRGPLSAGGVPYYGDLIAAQLERAGVRVETLERALDWGSSSGRVTRWLAAAYPEVDWHGADPNEGAIAWARRHLPEATFHVSPQDPPLPFADGHFDLVLAVSIWSHYGAGSALAWLAEMHRVIKPGGHLWLTTHGYQAIAHQVAVGRRSVRQLHEIREAMYRSGFWFSPDFGDAGDWGVKHREWGNSWISPEWMARHVTPGWLIEDFLAGGNASDQDVYLLRRR
jgi:SAM-dependent methyltransferase/glycosyltransferase involved in cell wall biosynthesis